MRFRLGRGAAATLTLLGAACLVVPVVARRQAGSPAGSPLPVGTMISPQGVQTGVGSFPVNMTVSPDGKFLAVTNTGYRQYISILNTDDGRLLSQVPFNPKGRGDHSGKSALYVGLAFAPNPGFLLVGQGEHQVPVLNKPVYTLYASRGPEDKISVFHVFATGYLTDTNQELDDPSGLPTVGRTAHPNFCAGLALNSNGTRLYVANNETSLFTNDRGSVSILDAQSNKILGKAITPGFPYALAAITQGMDKDKKVYVTSERDGVVTALEVSDPASPKTLRDIKTGDHPMALLLDKAQQRLFVANASSDTVSVINTARDTVSRTIQLRSRRTRELPGLTPTALALSPDETHLYVTLGDLNAVAIIDLQDEANVPQGLIPVGWYPTAIAVSADGKRLFVANAKGVQPRNPNGANVGPDGKWGQYIENILEGTVSVIPVPTATEMPKLTARVEENNRERNTAPLPKTGIKHVIYIIKENRTYDQVLGDLPQGNGDRSLTLFGRDVTPNLHALAERFVLLDNFYCCAEVSADGWNWSTSGMASEYAIRNVPFNYSGRGRDYDYEGTVNGVPVDLLGQPDVARAPGGYLWDTVAKKGLSYRNYGFFNAFDDLKTPDGKLLAKENAATERVLVGHTDTDYLRFDMDYSDSDAYIKYNCAYPTQKTKYGSHDAPSRIAEWKHEFDAYVKDGNLPAFLMVRLPRNHTSGTKPGVSSPRAMVADNDYAVGQLVEAVSHSKYWSETAIFVLEDDAQNGYDHVDAHRSPAFVISPHIKRSTVDHRFYNTDSFLRTMEQLLGLKPMNRYDARASLIQALGPTPDNAEPYDAILPAKEIIAEVNSARTPGARQSSLLDFKRADQVEPALLSRILWQSVKGAQAPLPSVVHTLPVTDRPTGARDTDD